MRIQFLVAAHRDPEFVWRLCTCLLRASDAGVMVQWDSGFDVPSAPQGLDVTVMPTRAPAGWGNRAQLDAVLDSLRALENKPFDWLIVISGQDYPVRPMAELEHLLVQTEHQLFVRLDEDETVAEPPTRRDEWTFLHDRYLRQYRWVPQHWWSWLSPQLQRVLSGAAKVSVQTLSRSKWLRVQRRPRGFAPGLGVAAREHPFSDARPCRKGSDWFALSRPVFDDLMQRDAGVGRAGRVLPPHVHPDRVVRPHAFASEVGADEQRIEPAVRAVPSQPAHPDTLTDDDWDDLVGSAEFFARKFDPEDLELLDRIDRELLA